MTDEEVKKLLEIANRIQQYTLALDYTDNNEFDVKELDAFYNFCIMHKEKFRDIIKSELESLKEELSSK